MTEMQPPADLVVRVASVQLGMQATASADELFHRLERFVRIAAGYRTDFVVFPELMTLQLLSCEPRRLPAAEAIEALSRHTERFISEVSAMAVRHGVNIVAGSHLRRADDGAVRNTSYVCLRDGSVHSQDKIHPTPTEREEWGVGGGSALHAIPTDRGLIGVLICYDAEFPELARKLADEGAKILFTPFCTDTREGYLRVRYCAQARAIENQLYVVTAGCVGELVDVESFDINYAASAIITPCDFRFARDGIAAEATENAEAVIFAHLDLADLAWARERGSVRNLGDRRRDLYEVVWKEGE